MKKFEGKKMENTLIHEMSYDEETRRVTADISLEFYNDLVKWAKRVF